MSGETAEEKQIWRAAFLAQVDAVRREVNESTTMPAPEKDAWHRFLTQAVVSSNGAPDKIGSMSDTLSAVALSLVTHVVRGPEALKAVLREEIPKLLAECKREDAQKIADLEKDQEDEKGKKNASMLFIRELLNMTPKQKMVTYAVLLYFGYKLLQTTEGLAILTKLISIL